MLSSELEKSLHRALSLAKHRGHELTTLEHLLLALCDDSDAVVVLRACGVDIDKLRSEGTKESYEMAKKLYPKMRVYAPVVVRGEESEGVRIWSFGKLVYQALLSLMMDEDYGDITDLKTGTDIKVKTAEEASAQND